MTAPTRLEHAQQVPWAMPSQVGYRLDELMTGCVRDLAGPLAAPLLRIVDGQGKRLRPALTLAVARLPVRGRHHDAVDPRTLHLAAAVELMHCATLVHDDLIDGASTRRGVPTLNAVEGDATAVIGGDLLVAAATLLAGQVSQYAGVVLAQTFAGLCRGEALQAQKRYDSTVSPQMLIEVAELKTGGLLRAACLLGADAAGAEPTVQDAIGTFGMSFGVCLQLVDDVLDIASTPGLAGKPVGADFVSGTVTVPGAFALAECPDLVDLLRPDLDSVSRQRAVTLLQHSDNALASALAIARGYAEEASDALAAVALADTDGAAELALAGWPQVFLDAQLTTKVSDQHRWLLSRPNAGR